MAESSVAGLEPEEELILAVRGQATSSFTTYPESYKIRPKKPHPLNQRTTLRKHVCAQEGMGLPYRRENCKGPFFREVSAHILP